MMDPYTLKTREWLNSRFTACDENGVYIAHQPIYGFRNGHSESEIILRYMRTYQIFKSLSGFNFRSLLDVGAAEGYTANLIKKIFDVYVETSDLSEEACKRATELFNLKATSVDIHNLPFKDNEFDIVISSETIEHVPDFKKAVEELLRVARDAVIITVPHESEKTINNNIDHELPHAHINKFNKSSFNYLKERDFRLITRKFSSQVFTLLYKITEASSKETRGRYPGWVIKLYNKLITVTRAIFNIRMTSFVISFDHVISKLPLPYSGIIVTIIKNKEVIKSQSPKKIKFTDVMRYKVPLYYLRKNDL